MQVHTFTTIIVLIPILLNLDIHNAYYYVMCPINLNDVPTNMYV